LEIGCHSINQRTPRVGYSQDNKWRAWFSPFREPFTAGGPGGMIGAGPFDWPQDSAPPGAPLRGILRAHGRGRRALRAIAASRPRTAKRRHELSERSGERTAPQPPADEVRRWDSSRSRRPVQIEGTRQAHRVRAFGLSTIATRGYPRHRSHDDRGRQGRRRYDYGERIS